MAKTIPVFLSSDNNYAPFVATTIASICDNTKSFIDFYVLDGGIALENRTKIESLKNQFKNFSIEFIKIDTSKEFNDIDYFNYANYITISTYNRFLIPKLKPYLAKVIYLDVDIVAKGDIQELYNEDLDGNILGAVWDESRLMYNTDTQALMDLSKDYKYFNAGVLLIDVAKWNKFNITKELFKIYKEYKDKVLHADETLLNKYFDGKYKTLNLKYNYTDFDAINHKLDNFIIRHFITKLKPWKIITDSVSIRLCPNIEDFWHYAEITPFKDELIKNIVDDIKKVTLLHKAKLEKTMLNMTIKQHPLTYIISVANDFNMYNKYVRDNEYLEIPNVSFKVFDNTKENKYISVRYNEFLNSYDFSKEAWFVFCHSDWEVLDNLNKILPKLDKNCIYGTAGAKTENYSGKYFNLVITSSYDRTRDDSKTKERLNFNNEFLKEVDSLDCQVIIVHSSLVQKYNLRFDENLPWDLYVEDFCINAKVKYEIKAKVVNINACHHSDAGFKTKPPQSYLTSLEYMNEKYKNEFFAGTVSFVGGAKKELITCKDHIFCKLRQKILANNIKENI